MTAIRLAAKEGLALINGTQVSTALAIEGLLAAEDVFVAGLAAGALNGIIIVRLGIPSLIATIGTQFLWRGAVNIITNGRSGVLTTPMLAVNRSDYPVIQAVTVYLAVLTMMINLGADMLYKFVDPRVVLK